MLEQVKQDMPAIHGSNSYGHKMEKTSPKSGGSGSPFKCIGLGLVQQMKSDKEEELSIGRHRLEELEALAQEGMGVIQTARPLRSILWLFPQSLLQCLSSLETMMWKCVGQQPSSFTGFNFFRCILHLPKLQFVGLHLVQMIGIPLYRKVDCCIFIFLVVLGMVIYYSQAQ